MISEELAEKMAGAEEGTMEMVPAAPTGLKKDPKSGKFLPGNRSGGRPLGSVSAATKARNLLASYSEELVELSMEQVRSGKSAALLAELLRFSLPPARSQLSNVIIPEAHEAMAHGDFDGALAAITQSVLSGETSPDVAKSITDQVKSAEESKRLRALTEEVESLQRRIVEGQSRRIG